MPDRLSATASQLGPAERTGRLAKVGSGPCHALLTRRLLQPYVASGHRLTKRRMHVRPDQ